MKNQITNDQNPLNSNVWIWSNSVTNLNTVSLVPFYYIKDGNFCNIFAFYCYIEDGYLIYY